MRASAGERLPVRMVELLLMGAEVTDFKENIINFFLHFTHNSIVLFFSSLSYFFGSWCPVKADISRC